VFLFFWVFFVFCGWGLVGVVWFVGGCVLFFLGVGVCVSAGVVLFFVVGCFWLWFGWFGGGFGRVVFVWWCLGFGVGVWVLCEVFGVVFWFLLVGIIDGGVVICPVRSRVPSAVLSRSSDSRLIVRLRHSKPFAGAGEAFPPERR